MLPHPWIEEETTGERDSFESENENSQLLFCFVVSTFDEDPRRTRSSQHVIIVPLEARHHQLSPDLCFTQNGAVTTTPSSSKVGSSKQSPFQIQIRCFVVSFSGEFRHRVRVPFLTKTITFKSWHIPLAQPLSYRSKACPVSPLPSL
jgi:hypothetical protein